MFTYDSITRCQSERSYYIEIFDNNNNNDRTKQYVLLVGQCGFGNYSGGSGGIGGSFLPISPTLYLSGFQSLTKPRGRYFRHYYHNFTRLKDKTQVREYWCQLINGNVDDEKDGVFSPHLKAAIFLHGDPIIDDDDDDDTNDDSSSASSCYVRDQLSQFYVY